VKARPQPISAASLIVVTLLYAWVSERATLPALLALGLAAAAAAGGRLSLGRGLERVGTALAAGAGAALAFTGEAIPPGPNALDRPWSALALAALLAATFRLFQREPEGGALVTTLAGLVALMASGEVPSGPVYTAAVGLYLALSLLAMRAGDRGRPSVFTLPRRAFAIAFAMLGSIVALAAVATRTLPPLSDWTTLHLVFAGGDRTTVGFSDRFWLGSLDGMLESDEVVMRLDGPRVDHLRGAVFDHYERGRWTDAHPGGAKSLPVADRPAEGPSLVRATRAGGERNRHFLPLGAHRVTPGEESALVDRFGAVRVPDDTAATVTFEVGDGEGLPIAPPAPEDSAIPAELGPTIDRLLSAWSAKEGDPEQRVATIASHLESDFTYARDFRRHHREPLLDFLGSDPRGHCEYFASAAVMLARGAGVPARVVAGYRVAEENPIGGYWIVREKNAHAWAEVYLPGKGWQTIDPTPAASLAQDQRHTMSFFAALGDTIAALWQRAGSGDAAVRGRQALAAIAVVVLLFVLWRRRRRLARERKGAAAAHAVEAPPEDLARLFEALARAGLARSPAEPLERFASRLDEAGRSEAAALVRRWAAHRYGGVGAAAPLLAEIQRHAAGLG
jgi:protein-glutamine gamma-glutamyltransferase